MATLLLSDWAPRGQTNDIFTAGETQRVSLNGVGVPAAQPAC